MSTEIVQQWSTRATSSADKKTFVNIGVTSKRARLQGMSEVENAVDGGWIRNVFYLRMQPPIKIFSMPVNMPFK